MADPNILICYGNKQKTALNTGEVGIHCFATYMGKLYALTWSTPVKLIIWNNPSDLTDRLSISLATDGRHSLSCAIAIDEINNALYVLFNGADGVYVSKIDDATGTISDIIIDTDVTSGDLGSLATDGTYIYIITKTTPAQILKYSISEATLTASAVINNGTSDENGGHAIHYDGTNLYATGRTLTVAWIAKINPSTLIHTVASITTGYTPTDDLTSDDDYVYIGMEGTSGNLFRFAKTDLSATTIETTVKASCYAMAYDGVYIWGAFRTSPGTLLRLNTVTLEYDLYTGETGEIYYNEIVWINNKMYVTCWGNDPAVVIRMDPPVTKTEAADIYSAISGNALNNKAITMLYNNKICSYLNTGPTNENIPVLNDIDVKYYTRFKRF